MGQYNGGTWKSPGEWRYKFMMRARPSPSSIVGGEKRERDCVWLSVARTRRERKREEARGSRCLEAILDLLFVRRRHRKPVARWRRATASKGSLLSPLLLCRHCTLDWSCSTLPRLLPRKQRPPDRHYIRAPHTRWRSGGCRRSL